MLFTIYAAFIEIIQFMKDMKGSREPSRRQLFELKQAGTNKKVFKPLMDRVYSWRTRVNKDQYETPAILNAGKYTPQNYIQNEAFINTSLSFSSGFP